MAIFLHIFNSMLNACRVSCFIALWTTCEWQEKNGGNCKNYFLWSTKCRRGNVCLLYKPLASPRSVYFKCCTGFDTQIWRYWFHMRYVFRNTSRHERHSGPIAVTDIHQTICEVHLAGARGVSFIKAAFGSPHVSVSVPVCHDFTSGCEATTVIFCIGIPLPIRWRWRLAFMHSVDGQGQFIIDW